MLAILCVADVQIPEETGTGKVVLAVIVLIRGVNIILTFKPVPLIGPLIIAVIHSFVPMIGMFLFMIMVLLLVLASFLIVKDEDRSIFFVFVYVYQLLFLTERDAAESV